MARLKACKMAGNWSAVHVAICSNVDIYYAVDNSDKLFSFDPFKLNANSSCKELIFSKQSFSNLATKIIS